MVGATRKAVAAPSSMRRLACSFRAIPILTGSSVFSCVAARSGAELRNEVGRAVNAQATQKTLCLMFVLLRPSQNSL